MDVGLRESAPAGKGLAAPAMAACCENNDRCKQRDLHQPDFDIDERALAVGVRVLVNIVEQAAGFE